MVKSYSDSIEAMKKRIQRLPKLIEGRLESYAKKNADGLITRFHDGIMKDQLGLWPLKERTIATKEALGYDLPESPLYGLGDADPDKTYSNMMETVKEEKAWKVRPKKGYHHSKNRKHRIKLRDLFIVHEYGTTILNGFGRGIFIRIPPRPAMTYAYKKLMEKLRREEPAKKVRHAISQHIKGALDFAKDKAIERMGGST